MPRCLRNPNDGLTALREIYLSGGIGGAISDPGGLEKYDA